MISKPAVTVEDCALFFIDDTTNNIKIRYLKKVKITLLYKG
jgi:hypothetical protein